MLTVITPEQLAKYRRDGFVKLERFLPESMLHVLRDGYARAIAGEFEVDDWRGKHEPDSQGQTGPKGKFLERS